MTMDMGEVADVIFPPGLKVIVISAFKETAVPEPDNGTGQEVRPPGQSFEKVPLEGQDFFT